MSCESNSNYSNCSTCLSRKKQMQASYESGLLSGTYCSTCTPPSSNFITDHTFSSTSDAYSAGSSSNIGSYCSTYVPSSDRSKYENQSSSDSSGSRNYCSTCCSLTNSFSNYCSTCLQSSERSSSEKLNLRGSKINRCNKSPTSFDNSSVNNNRYSDASVSESKNDTNKKRNQIRGRKSNEFRTCPSISNSQSRSNHSCSTCSTPSNCSISNNDSDCNTCIPSSRSFWDKNPNSGFSTYCKTLSSCENSTTSNTNNSFWANCLPSSLCGTLSSGQNSPSSNRINNSRNSIGSKDFNDIELKSNDIKDDSKYCSTATTPSESSYSKQNGINIKNATTGLTPSKRPKTINSNSCCDKVLIGDLPSENNQNGVANLNSPNENNKSTSYTDQEFKNTNNIVNHLRNNATISVKRQLFKENTNSSKCHTNQIESKEVSPSASEANTKDNSEKGQEMRGNSKIPLMDDVFFTNGDIPLNNVLKNILEQLSKLNQNFLDIKSSIKKLECEYLDHRTACVKPILEHNSTTFHELKKDISKEFLNSTLKEEIDGNEPLKHVNYSISDSNTSLVSSDVDTAVSCGASVDISSVNKKNMKEPLKLVNYSISDSNTSSVSSDVHTPVSCGASVDISSVNKTNMKEPLKPVNYSISDSNTSSVSSEVDTSVSCVANVEMFKTNMKKKIRKLINVVDKMDKISKNDV